MATKRIWLTSEEEKVDLMLRTAEAYGIPVSNYVGLCAWIGHRIMLRTLEPESVYTPEQIVQMYMAAKAQGLDVIEPETDQMKGLIADALEKKK